MEIPPKPKRPECVVDPMRPSPVGGLMIWSVAAFAVFIVARFIVAVVKVAGG